MLRKHWPGALTKETKKDGPLPIDEDTSEVTIRPTAGHFEDYYLDFENHQRVEESGRFHFSRNLILNKQKASGGIWSLAKTGTGWLIRVQAHSDFEGWYLDFDNHATAKRIGGFTSANNLLLTQERVQVATGKLQKPTRVLRSNQRRANSKAIILISITQHRSNTPADLTFREICS